MQTNQLEPISSKVKKSFSILALAVLAQFSISSYAATDAGGNPDLEGLCGLDVALVLDESGSIENFGAIEQVRTAANAFISSLSDTGSRVQIVEFNTRARTAFPPTEVTRDNLIDFQNYVNDADNDPATGYDPADYSGFDRGTNWEGAFRQVLSQESSPLLVVVTDGDPTFYLQDPDNINIGGNGSTTVMESYQDALPAADLIKQSGTHILMVGVGPGLTSTDQLDRLKGVSGPDLVDDAANYDLSTTDVLAISDFSNLAAAFRQVVVSLCAPSVAFKKLAKDVFEADFTPEPNWEFTATVQPSSGAGFVWKAPNPGSTATTESALTDQDGIVNFQWATNPQLDTSAFTWDETQMDFTFVDAQCVRKTFESDGVTELGFETLPMETFTVAANEIVTCSVRNERNSEMDLCEDGKPAGLYFRYDGSGAEDDTHTQISNEVTISGDPLDASPVYIEVYDHHRRANLLFADSVDLNGSFSISGTKRLIPPRMRFLIYNEQGGTLLQTVQFHTSCSQPLAAGDSFGSIVVLGETK